MKDFRRLKVWEKVHLLTLDIYKVTAGFPRDEMYGSYEPDAEVRGINGSKYRRRMWQTRK
jgi:hypothetical protein